MLSPHIPTDQLLDILAEECIFIEYLDLVYAHGFYLYLEECTVIGISNAVTQDEKLFRTVLAEEIGHHFTVTSNKQPVQYLTYRDRLSLDKSESAALRWAADFLIPDNLLFKYLGARSLMNFAEMCDFFLVTDYLLLQKFTALSRKKAVYELENGAQLILSNMPSNYIYNPLEAFDI